MDHNLRAGLYHKSTKNAKSTNCDRDRDAVAANQVRPCGCKVVSRLLHLSYIFWALSPSGYQVYCY